MRGSLSLNNSITYLWLLMIFDPIVLFGAASGITAEQEAMVHQKLNALRATFADNNDGLRAFMETKFSALTAMQDGKLNHAHDQFQRALHMYFEQLGRPYQASRTYTQLAQHILEQNHVNEPSTSTMTASFAESERSRSHLVHHAFNTYIRHRSKNE